MNPTKTGWLSALLLAGAGLAAQDAVTSWQHHNFSFELGAADGRYYDTDQTTYYPYGTFSHSRSRGSSGAIFEVRYAYQYHRNWEWTIGTGGLSNKVHYSYQDNNGPWVDNGSSTINASVLLTGFKGHWHPTGRGFNLYGGGEIGYGVVDGGPFDKDHGLAWALSAGAEFPLADHFRFRLEAKRTAINAEPRRYYCYYCGSPAQSGFNKPAYPSLAAVFVIGWGG